MKCINTLLDSIKAYPEVWIDTALMRSNTTPSILNREYHLLLVGFIEGEKWEDAEEVLTAYGYRKPLEGVVFCLNTHGRLGYEEHSEIVKLFQQGNFI